MLATLAKVAARTGRKERAAEIIGELESQPRRWPMPSIRALTAEAKAALMVSNGRRGDALQELQTARDLWAEAGCIVSGAEIRIELARLLLAQGDLAGAELEAKAAEANATRVESRRLGKLCQEIGATLTVLRHRGIAMATLPGSDE
jgi:hypothetical protein